MRKKNLYIIILLMSLLVIKQLVIMLIIMAAGFIFARAFKVSEQEQKFLSKLLLYLINPLMVFNSFNREFDVNKLKQLGFVVLLVLAVHGIMILVGKIATYHKNPEEKERLKEFDIIDKVAVVFTNCGFVGIPLISGVYGSEGVFYLMGYIIVFNVLLWTYGYYQIAGSVKPLKIILNPNIIAIVLGVIFYCFQIKLPEILQKPVSMIGDSNTCVAMLLLGILLAGFKKPESNEFMWRIIRFIFLRLVVCALLSTLFLTLVYRLCILIPEDKFFASREILQMILFVILICTMCPAATSIPSLACVFDLNATYASMIVSLTSVVCMISIPAFVALAELFIK